MSKQLKSFGVLRGTSQVERNSIDTTDYAYEDTCRNSLTVFFIFGFEVYVKTDEYFQPEKIQTLFVHSGCQW